MKRKLLIGFGIVFLVIILAFIWGIGIEPRLFLDEQERTANIPNLPDVWNEKKVAVIGDFQVGLWLDNDGMVRKAVNDIVEKEPALVLITGDFIYHSPSDPAKEISHMADILRPLKKADIPVYAVFGNHDYSMARKTSNPNFERAEKIRTAMESIGIRVLQNNAVILEYPWENASVKKPLYLVGVGANWPDMADVEKAFSTVPGDAPRLVLMHHPDIFAQIPAHAAPFAVAGHTHGGQIAIPFTPEWTWMNYYRNDEVHADGWIKGYGEPGNDLYVNRGIGCSIAPIRINAPPELSLFTLKRSGQPQSKQ